MSDSAADYKVELSRKYARVLVYEDPKGSIQFTIDVVPGSGDKGLFLEGRTETGATAERQAWRNTAYERGVKYLEKCGYRVTDPEILDRQKVKKAVILAAGKGTRMGDLTASLPKPMVQVEGKPVLEHIIEGLRDAAKITELFIVTGWCGHVIRDYFGNGSRWNVAIT
jgi:hypothetical protein